MHRIDEKFENFGLEMTTIIVPNSSTKKNVQVLLILFEFLCPRMYPWIYRNVWEMINFRMFWEFSFNWKPWWGFENDFKFLLFNVGKRNYDTIIYFSNHSKSFEFFRNQISRSPNSSKIIFYQSLILWIWN